MRKILAGLAVAAAGVVGGAGMASAHYVTPEAPQPWDTMCAREWNKLHPESRVDPVEYENQLYRTEVRILLRYIPLPDPSPRRAALEQRWTKYQDAWGVQKRCRLYGHP